MSGIHISTSRTDQARAAEVLSKYLNDLGCDHAYIGGFAWSLLGSERATQINIDILVETKNIPISDLRDQILKLDSRFATEGFKFYFVEESSIGLRDGRNNVLIETLPAGRLGLPSSAGPTYMVPGSVDSIAILHPSVLILTKLKRWAINCASTRPKTMLKNRSDQIDIEFMIYWLFGEKMLIGFDSYQGKSKGELLAMVRRYYDKFLDNEVLMGSLKSLMQSDEWMEMLRLPMIEQESTIPPVD